MTKNIAEIDDLNIEINRFLFNDRIRHFNIYGKKSSKLIKLFEERIPLINAGGGLVVNDEGEYLLIYRNKKWDLPKGKQEHGEEINDTALREVSEECGLSLSNLNIVKDIDCSYHMYENDPGFTLKKTTWFLMHYSGDEIPSPEMKEGITKAEWFAQDEMMSVLKKSYSNIRNLVDKFDFSTE